MCVKTFVPMISSLTNPPSQDRIRFHGHESHLVRQLSDETLSVSRLRNSNWLGMASPDTRVILVMAVLIDKVLP
jgi:hypothetical protein